MHEEQEVVNNPSIQCSDDITRKNSHNTMSKDELNDSSAFYSKYVPVSTENLPFTLFSKRKAEAEKIVKKEAKRQNIDKETQLILQNGNTFGKSFKDLNVPQWLIELATSIKITKPTKIQELCLPAAFSHKNIIGCAQTGTGKTICFCWPILVALSKDPFGVFGLVLTTSRELAYQIGDQFNIFGVQMNINVCICVGGVDIIKQSIQLENRPHIVIGTPGRLADQVSVHGRNISKIYSNVKYLVFDEADKLLHTSFQEPLQQILKCLPSTKEGRITYLFSATITRSIKEICNSFDEVQFHLFDVTENATSVFNGLDLKHEYLFLPRYVHMAYLVHLLQRHLLKNDSTQGIIFTATKRRCQLVSLTLELLKFKVSCIQSLMKQRKRNASLAKFRSGVSNLLVATDLVSRGIDIPAVEFVINLDFPSSSDDYIHRVGRTARSGREGLALSFVDEKDVEKVKRVEACTNIKLQKFNVVDKDAVKVLNKVSVATQKALIFLREIDYGKDD